VLLAIFAGLVVIVGVLLTQVGHSMRVGTGAGAAAGHDRRNPRSLQNLLAQPSALLRVPVFLLALLVVRGLPALLYLSDLGRHAAIAAGLLQATSLSFLVTAATIGMQAGTMSSVTGAALICAGLLSVVIFPAAALSRLREHAHPSTASTPASPSDTSAHSEAM
jgi:hypothetical protein